MPTLRRILKYTPAVVLGLLVVAWIVSTIYRFEVALVFGKNNAIGYGHANIDITWDFATVIPVSFHGAIRGWGDLSRRSVAGCFGSGAYDYRWVNVPLPFISLLLPIAIGPFISFRFRLWH